MRLIEKYQTKAQHAAELGVVPRTIENWCNLPDPIPSYRIGGRRMFKLEATEAWLERQRIERQRIEPPKRRGRPPKGA
jgi:hypothetical protein